MQYYFTQRIEHSPKRCKVERVVGVAESAGFHVFLCGHQHHGDDVRIVARTTDVVHPQAIRKDA
jgi:hypothetical protein